MKWNDETLWGIFQAICRVTKIVRVKYWLKCLLFEQPYRTTPLILPGAKVKKEVVPNECYLRHHPNPTMRGRAPHIEENFLRQRVRTWSLGNASNNNIMITLILFVGIRLLIQLFIALLAQTPNRERWKWRHSCQFICDFVCISIELKLSEFFDRRLLISNSIRQLVFTQTAISNIRYAQRFHTIQHRKCNTILTIVYWIMSLDTV